MGTETTAIPVTRAAKSSGPRVTVSPKLLRSNHAIASDFYEEEAEELSMWLAERGYCETQESPPRIHPASERPNSWGLRVAGPVAEQIKDRCNNVGDPLPPALQGLFENKLQQDLGNVQIHNKREDRAIVRRLGAEAFAMGRHIFLDRQSISAERSADRRLLAHEVVHVVQQGATIPLDTKTRDTPVTESKSTESCPSIRAIQCSFTRTTTDLDPKVAILIDLHLADLPEIKRRIAPGGTATPSDVWWRELRQLLEGTGAHTITPEEAASTTADPSAGSGSAASTTTPDLDSVVNDAIQSILGYAGEDSARSPIQNGLAGLLADYLKLNDAPEQAAKVTLRFPFLKTALLRDEVVTHLSSESVNLDGRSLLDRIGRSATRLFGTIWMFHKPATVTNDSWINEIAEAFDEYLSLPPLPQFDQQKQALIDRLSLPLTAVPGVPPAGTSSAFDSLSASSTLSWNELNPIAASGLQWFRQMCAGYLTALSSRTPESTGNDTITLWRENIALLHNGATTLIRQSPEHFAIPTRQVIQAAGVEASEGLSQATGRHVRFWDDAYRRSNPRDPSPETTTRLRDRLGERTYAELFLTEESRSLMRAIRTLAPIIAQAFSAYFNHGFAAEDGTSGQEQTEVVTPQVLARRHREAIPVLVETLQSQVMPALAEKVYEARQDLENPNASERISWFAAILGSMIDTLQTVAENQTSGDSNNEEPSAMEQLRAEAHDRILQISTRRRIAEYLLMLAEAALETELQEPEAEGERPRIRHRYRGELAAPYRTLFNASLRVIRQADIQTSILIVRNPFERDESAQLSQFATDTSSQGRVHGLGPISSSDLLIFLQTFRATELAGELDSLAEMREEAMEQDPSLPEQLESDWWVISQASRNLRDRRGEDAMPQRFKSENIVWWPYPGEDNEGFFTAHLHRDPLFMHFSAHLSTDLYAGPNHPHYLYERHTQNMGDLWAWTIPDYSSLIRTLYRSTILRGLVAIPETDFTSRMDAAVAHSDDEAELGSIYNDIIEHAQIRGAAIDATQYPANLSAWLLTLDQRTSRISSVLGRNLRSSASVRRQLLSQRTVATNVMNHAYRRATSADRIAISTEIRRLFDDDATSVPNITRIIDLMQVFRDAVRPSESQEIELQCTALVLENAEGIIELASDNPLGLSRSDLFPFISMAAERLAVPAASAGSLLKPNRARDNPQTTFDESRNVDINSHAEGIAWDDASSWNDTRILIAQHRQAISDLRASMIQSLRDPLQWKLGITGTNTDTYSAPAQDPDDPAVPPSSVGSLKSHLAQAFPVYTAASIQARNNELEEGEEDQRQPDSFMIDPGGLSIRILRVIQPFTFIPGVGDFPGASDEEMGEHAYFVPGKVFVGIAASNASELPSEAHIIENPRGEPIVNDNIPPPPSLDLVEVQAFLGDRELSRFIIRADDLQGSRSGLRWLTNIVHGKSQSAELENLADIVEAYGEGLMLAASLFPPTALAVTAAEVGMLVAQITSNDGFMDALTAIWEEPTETIDRIITAVTERFTVDGLFDLALNGNFDASAFVGSTDPGRRSGGRVGGSRVAAIFRRIRMIAAAFAIRLERFQDRAQRPIRRIETVLSRHSRLAGIVNWVGDNVDAFDDPVGRALQHRIIGPILQAYFAFRRHGISDEEGIAAIADPLPTIAEGLQEGINGMMNFELPATIIPLEMAVQAVVEGALASTRHMGSRGKIVFLVGQIIREGAHATGVAGIFYRQIADLLEDSPVDPNVYWRDALPSLKPPIEGTIRETAATLQNYLREAPLIGDYFGNDRTGGSRISSVALPNADSAGSTQVAASEQLDSIFESDRANELVPADDDARTVSGEISYSTISSLPDVFFDNIIEPEPASEEIAPDTPGEGAAADLPTGSPLVSRENVNAPGPLATSAHPSSPFSGSNGAPLPPPVRAESERVFGHDFSHVRLHHGPASWAATGARGIDGLTSGSHIFLRPDLSLRSGRGERVMRHELAHVLQKTQGARGAARGQSGPSAGGLRWNRDEERAADQMAESSFRNPAGAPIPVIGAHKDGFSPAVSTELMGTFFKKISSPAGGESFAEAVERAHSAGRSADVVENTRRAAGLIANAFLTKLNGDIPADSPFANDETRTFIREHVKAYESTLYRSGERIPSVRSVLAHLAERSQIDPPHSRSRSRSTSRSRSAADDGPQPTFDARSFLNDLSLYITGRTGVVFSLSLPRRTVTTLSDNAASLNDDAMRSALTARINRLELLFVTSHHGTKGRDIWDKAIRKSWNLPATDDVSTRREALRRVLIAEYGADPNPPAPGSGPDASLPSTASADPRGSYASIWKSEGDLELNETYKARVEAQMHPATLSAAVMPNYEYYTDPDGQSLRGRYDEQERVSKNAMHYGTHGQLTRSGAYRLADNSRNSHHIVQYLLPEYFRNIKQEKPFPDPVPYPGGITAGGGVVDSVTAGSETIQIKETEEGSNRGNRMPAILLSAEAHQNSELHITPQADDTDANAQASQGYAIHRIFEKKLIQRTGRSSWTAAQTYLKGNATNSNAATQLVQAIRDTAEWVWIDTMKPSLQNRMPAVEARFYLNQFIRPDGTVDPLLSSIHGDREPTFEQVRSAISQRVDSSVLDDKLQTLRDLGWAIRTS